MDLTSERIRVARRLKAAESELQQAIRDRDGSPQARARERAARIEYDLANGEARLLLTLLAAAP